MIDAYAAGLIDGEGCLSVDRTFCPTIDVGMAKPALPTLRWLEATYGGSVRLFREATDTWQAAYAWSLRGAMCGPVLERWQPYLQVKRPQADLLIELVAIRPGYGGKRWDPQKRERAAVILSEIRRLNRRGPDVVGVDPDAPADGYLIAVDVAGDWTTHQMDLLSDQGQGWQMFSEAWPTSGCMTSHGVYAIPGILESPSGGGVSSSLRDVLEATVPERYFLSPRAASGILRRAEKRGRELPPHLLAALRVVAESTRPDDAKRTT